MTRNLERNPKDISARKTFVRKRQKSEGSPTAVVELTKSYCRCNTWIKLKENMAMTLFTIGVVLVLCICGFVFVFASPKLDTSAKAAPTVNYILPQSGFKIEDSTKPTTVSSHKDLSVSLALFTRTLLSSYEILFLYYSKNLTKIKLYLQNETNTSVRMIDCYL